MNTGISKKICELRKAHSLTQEQLGIKLGVSSQAISKWEKGESMPDIMLLPRICEIFGVSADALLEVPVNIKYENMLIDFCTYASRSGKSKALINVFSRMFNSFGNKSNDSWVDFGADYICIYDNKGMGFVVNGDAYLKSCIEDDIIDILYILNILSDKSRLSILRLISMEEAITIDEISLATGLDEITINQILNGFLERRIIVCDKDSRGRRGYLFGEAMAGIYMLLAGCQVLSDKGALNSYVRFTRLHGDIN